MNKPIHVLYVPSWYTSIDRPAFGVYFDVQFNALAKNGIKAGAIFPDQFPIQNIFKLKNSRIIDRTLKKTSWEKKDNVTVLKKSSFRVPFFTNMTKRAYIKQCLDLIDKYVEKEGLPDIIHAHTVFDGGFGAAAIAKKINRPFVITEHMTHFLRDLIKDKKAEEAIQIYKQAKSVYAVGQILADNISNLYKGPVAVIPNFIDTSFFTLPSKQRSNDTLNILSIGSLDEKKGFDTLIKGFSLFHKENPSSKLKIVGQGPLFKNLKELVAEKQLENAVQFLGLQSQENIKKILHESNLFALASRYETFGVVYIEALATGIPVIATRSGGPESFLNNSVATIIDKDDVEELAIQFKKTLNLQLKRTLKETKLLEEERHDFVVKNFSQDIVVTKQIEEYKKILK